MKRFISLVAFVATFSQLIFAQTPKWAEKARQAVFSVMTYDATGKLLGSGNGFYISEDGVAVSDYAAFKGASKAEIIDIKGEKAEVLEIMGANEMYDVIKFRVATNGKKVATLEISETPMAVGSKAYLMPYSTQKNVQTTMGDIKDVSNVASTYKYYTISVPIKEKMVSCPLMDSSGKVFGLAQMSSDSSDENVSYAVDVRYAVAQTISALSMNDGSLMGVGIKKSLPEDAEQALVMLYMASSSLSEEAYSNLLDDFITKFPTNADGYLRRATNRISISQEENSLTLAEQDMDKALTYADAENKADILYNRANLMYNYLLLDKPTFKDWNWDKAIGEVKQAEQLAPDVPSYHQLEGDIAFAKQDYSSALAAFTVVNSSSFASANSFYSAAHCKELLGSPVEEIIALMDSCVGKFNQPYTQEAAPYLLERARAYETANKPRLAMSDYEEYSKAMKGQVTDKFYALKARVEMQAKAFQNSLDDYAKAIDLNPEELTYRAELAVVNMRVGRNQEAIAIIDEALTKDDKYAELYRLKGLALLQMKKNKDARSFLDKAKELGDPNVDAVIKKYYK